MRLKISHTTTYTYDQPVLYGLQQVRLTPITDNTQTIWNWAVIAEGGTQELQCTDQYENQYLLIKAQTGATQVTLTASGEVETHCSNGIYGQIYGRAPLWHFTQATPRTAAGPNVSSLCKQHAQGSWDIAKLHTLSQHIRAAVPYGQGVTNVTTTAEEALRLARGVCQDHAQIFIAVLRCAGVPARYVSGYLKMDDRIDQDATHAWAEAHLEGLGWVAFDVSNGISPDERYLRLAVGRDSADAAPVSGLRLGNTQETMRVTVQVQQ